MTQLIDPRDIVSRTEWEADRAKKTEKLKTPVDNIVITWTGSLSCRNKKDCKKRVKEIQKSDMEKDGQPDIKYNFLIGGDGKVYEGRGWKVATDLPSGNKKAHTQFDGKSIVLAFIGPKDSVPTNQMMLAIAGISGMALNMNYINRNVKITRLDGEDTDSYDLNIDEEIEKEKNRVQKQKNAA